MRHISETSARALRNGGLTGAVIAAFWVCLDFALRAPWPVTAVQAALLLVCLAGYAWSRTALRRSRVR